MKKRMKSMDDSRDGPPDYSLDQTIQKWSEVLTEGAEPSVTLDPPKGFAEIGFEERLSTVIVTRGDSPGAFKILEAIGFGGMGEVRSARQESLHRVVALKQLREQIANDPQARHRFVAEALVTGDLDHPNIVPVYELAKTEQGEPFYAMKLIRGVAWIDVIDSKTTEENLEILTRVCDAVAFAHSRGVLHRDLKPHNVMLGEYGEVLLVDWGLGVSMVPGGKAPTLTYDNALAGTASYMAPEMAAGDPSQIGIQTDVYLLGAILFRIVTGQPPHPGDTVTECLVAAFENRLPVVDGASDLADIARTACATSPGDRFRDVRSFQDALRDAASHAQSRRLGDRAREMLCEAEDSQCYQTYQRAQFGFEEALALWEGNNDALVGFEENRRSFAEAALANEDLDLAASLVPKGETAWSAFADRVDQLRRRRDARRNRIRFLSRLAALLTATILLVLGIAVVLVSREKNRVVLAEARASEQRNLALQALDTLVFSVNDSLEGRPAMEGLRKAILDEAIAGLTSIAEAQSSDPLVDRRLGIAHQSMARIFQAARRNAEARDHQERAVSVFERLRSGERTETADHDLAVALQLLGEIVSNYRMGDLEAARVHYQRALKITDDREQDGVLSEDVRVLRATLLGDLGDLAFDLGEIENSRALYGQFMAEVRSLTEVEKPTLESRELYSSALTRLADLYLRQDDNSQGYATYERALDVALDLVAEDSNSAHYKRLVGLAEFNLADTARKAGRLDVSASHHERAREIQTRLVNADASNGAFRRDLLVTVWGMGELTRDQGRSAEALALYEEALRVAEDLLKLNPDNLQARRDVFICCKEVGAVYQEQGLLKKARAAFERGLRLCRSIQVKEPESFGAQTDIVIALYFLADLEAVAHRPDEARLALMEGLQILTDLDSTGRLAEDSPYRAWINELQIAIDVLP